MLQESLTPNKKARCPRPPRLRDLAAPVRLHIYGFLNKKDTYIEYDEDKDDYCLCNFEEWNDLIGPHPVSNYPQYEALTVKSFEIEIAFACIVGDLEVLQYVHSFSDTLSVPEEVAERDVGEYEKNLHLVLFYRINALLIYHRNWKTLRWAREMQFPWDEWSFNIAILTGVDERILKWLHRRGCPWSSPSSFLCMTFVFAVGCCSLDFIKWLRLQGCPWTGACFDRAIQRGDWEIITWLRINGCPILEGDPCFRNDALAQAVQKTDILYVQYLLHEFDGTRCDIDFLYVAMRESDISVLQLLVDAGYQFDHYTYYIEPIRYRKKLEPKLECLQFLRRTGCPWNEEVFVAAVESGDMEILRWLRQEGCPWDATVFNAALEKGNLEMIQWLFEQKCPMDEDSINALRESYALVPR
jgi:hypothetical protein